MRKSRDSNLLACVKLVISVNIYADSELARCRCRKSCFPKLIALNNFSRECLFYIRCFCGKLQGAQHVTCDFSFWNVTTTLYYPGNGNGNVITTCIQETIHGGGAAKM